MFKVVVFISGSGTNLRSIIEKSISYNYKVVGVVADRECGGLEIARLNNIPHILSLNKDNFYKKVDKILSKDIDLIILAGFLSIINKEFVNRWNKKIINLHPSLLPKYGGKGMYGLKVHSKVLEDGEKVTGATVHYVDSGIDTGSILLQESIDITEELQTPQALQEAVKAIEHKLLPKAIEILANKREGELISK